MSDGNGDGRTGRNRLPLAEPGHRSIDRRAQLGRWLRPGIGIKRWVLVVFLGELLLALAGAIVLRSMFRDATAADPPNAILDLLTLQFLPPEVRLAGLFGVGVVVFAYGWWRLLKVLIEPYQVREEPLVELLYQRRLRARGPNIVTIGGGTGLSMLLRGLKELTSNITAVVTVADDGGSSGKLRTEMGLPPMGDIRNCIEALADAEPAMTRLLHYRFVPPGPGFGGAGPAVDETTPFAGHAFGNLLIAALTDITGDFEEAVRQSNRVLAVRGNVVPVAGRPITLHAELEDGSTLDGQSRIARAKGIRRVRITPANIRPAAEALDAVANADIIVIGPGSLYTSVLPNLVVDGIRRAVMASDALKVYVCNVATQRGETDGFGVAEHIQALLSHLPGNPFDYVIANTNLSQEIPSEWHVSPVVPEGLARLPEVCGSRVVLDDVVDPRTPLRHDPEKLARVLLRLLSEKSSQSNGEVRSADAMV